MKIGKINDQLKNLRFTVNFENTTLSPLERERSSFSAFDDFLLKWNTIRCRPLEVKVSFDEFAFIERAVIKVGEKTSLTSVELKNGADILSKHSAETGKNISSQTIELECALLTKSFSIVFFSNYSDIEIQTIDFYGYSGEISPLFPIPKSAKYGEYISKTQFSSYCADSEYGAWAGRILSEKFFEKTSIELEQTNDGADIHFITDTSLSKNAYRLSITKNQTQIFAGDFRGFVMGAEAFIKLTDSNGVRSANIDDAPAHPFRGIHIYLPGESQMEFARRFIKYLVSPMGYNTVIIEVAAGLLYESRPQINDVVKDALEKARRGVWPPFPHGVVAEGVALNKSLVREFIDYVKSYGLEVIPEVQSLGHVPYITMTYPEVAEVDENETVERVDIRLEDAVPSKFYPHCYCPSNEKSYEILFDLLDEVIELFEPKEYVHMGHDEVYYLGLCPKCKGKPHSELLASDVNRIYEHLKNKGLKMMIWSDMLQPVTKYQTSDAADMIPKDIICLDFIWYFHPDKDIEDNLLDKGFKVAIGNLYSSHFPRFESRIIKDGMIGGQISMWARTNEEKLQLGGKLYDIFMVAQMLWDDSYSHFCNICYDKIISSKMKELRESLKGIKYPSSDKSAITSIIFENSYDLTDEYLDKKPLITVNGQFNSLIISHTLVEGFSTLPMTPSETIARYVLKYEDGKIEDIEIKNGVNIGFCNRRQNAPIKHKLFRHYGYTATYETDGDEIVDKNGNIVTFYEYEHVLKDKKLLSIEFKTVPEFESEIFIKSIKAVKI